MNNYGYVCFTDQKYLELAKIIVDHINEFSKYKIQLFTINCDADFDYPCLIKTRVNFNYTNTDEKFRKVCYTKIYAAYNNVFDFGLILDGDMIPLPSIDEVIDNNLKFINHTYPICSRHPDNPQKQPAMASGLKKLQSMFNCKHSIDKFVYSHFLFSKSMADFFDNWYKTCCYLERQGITPVDIDEGVLNVLLSEIPDYEDIGYNYMPDYQAYPDCITGKSESKYIARYTANQCPLHFNILHGCKDNNIAKEYSNTVKATKDIFLNSKREFNIEGKPI